MNTCVKYSYIYFNVLRFVNSVLSSSILIGIHILLTAL